ncbi:hypothetical protein [Gimibacter soli]|uniref:Rod shape-determining protein MreD n=1 Tax=Gimibacter soli TaxID=3024400 RepID=A0AAE9XM98_9PROT|nr:hypothetical protein [Gimibacter soli]WCL53547.1 hypothetical protein PH603_13490 [Gimibacter soli]
MTIRRPTLARFGLSGYLPVIITFICAFMMLLPLGTSAANVTIPHLALASAFYWLSSRPLLMPYGACALIGFFLDLWLDVPMGLNVGLLVLTRFFVLNQLKHYKGRSRIVYWAVFTGLSFALYAIAWAVTSIVRGDLWPLVPILTQWAVTAVSFGPLALVFGRIRRSVM